MPGTVIRQKDRVKLKGPYFLTLGVYGIVKKISTEQNYTNKCTIIYSYKPYRNKNKSDSNERKWEKSHLYWYETRLLLEIISQHLIYIDKDKHTHINFSLPSSSLSTAVSLCLRQGLVNSRRSGNIQR